MKAFLLQVTIIICAFSGISFADERPSIYDSRAQKKIASTPFFIDAYVESPFNVDVYENIGFNAVTCYLDPTNKAKNDRILSTTVAKNIPTHLFCMRIAKKDGETFIEQMKYIFKKYPNIIGIAVGDESDPAEFDMLRQKMDKIREIAPNVLVYHSMRGIDLAPSYIEPNKYEEYVDTVITKLQPDVLMFNMYPFYRKGLAAHFFRNLEVLTSKAKKAGVPCFNWLQGFAFLETDKWPHHAPSESELRFQAFISLAYGCKALSYWTYDSHYHPYGKCITDESGKPSSIAEDIKSILPEIKILGEAMKNLQNISTWYYPANEWRDGKWTKFVPLGVNVPEAKKSPILVKSITTTEGNWGAFLGVFENKTGQKYVMIVNCNHGYKMNAYQTQASLSIKFSEAVESLERIDRKTGKSVLVPLYQQSLDNYILPGGTGELFKINCKK